MKVQFFHLFYFLSYYSLFYILTFRDSGFGILYELDVGNKEPTFYPLKTPEKEEEEEDKWKEIERIASEAPQLSKEFKFSSVVDYAKAYKEQITSPEEVAHFILKFMKERNSKLYTFIDINEKLFLEQAKESTKRHQDGNPKSIFDGVPVAVKDELDLSGYETRHGTISIKNNILQVDAPCLKELREKGALFIGKTNMAEIGITPRSLNIHYGFARNPYNSSHETGGSSSGSGASVGMGLCPFAIGADGGGSVRIPANFCGVFGLKPTQGRIPSKQQTKALCYTVDVLGPLAANATDLTLAYASMSGRCQEDQSTFIQPKSLGLKKIQPKDPNFYSLSKIKIGVFWDYFMDCEKEVSTSCKKMLDIYKEKYNAEIVDIKIPLLEACRIGHLVSITSEMFSSISKEFLTDKSKFYSESRVALRTSQFITGGDYIQAQKIRTCMMEVLENLFKQVDVIITPTTADVAPEITQDMLENGESNLMAVSQMMKYVFLANFTGIPAISIPIDYSKKGLPIGLQINGKWWDETTLLKFAYVTEREVDRKIPENYFPNL